MRIALLLIFTVAKLIFPVCVVCETDEFPAFPALYQICSEISIHLLFLFALQLRTRNICNM